MSPRLTGPTQRRAELADRAQHLRAQGLLLREIAADLGVSYSYAQALAVGDPLGDEAKRRKDSYRGTCADCGGPTTGSEGPSNLPVRCAACAALCLHESRHWTAERIIAAFQEFAAVMGRAPGAMDCPAFAFTPTNTGGRFSAERLAETQRAKDLGLTVPAPSIVERELGSWSAAIEAAGLDPNPSGGAGHRAPRRTERRTTVRSFVILERDGDHWIDHDPVQALNEPLAIETFCELAEKKNGQYVAIPDKTWAIRELRPVTNFQAVAVNGNQRTAEQ